MTGLEQNLRYIEREIRFMVKDQYGNPTHAKFADRVIEDACGIPNFCSTVLSSKRPLTAILRAVRGPRGDILMRFFNARLHDTRIEMVLVLVDATNCRMHTGREARNSYEYFNKLYRKAMKRMIHMITGSKNKDSFKSMYRGLRDFAKMDDYDYDEDDDDEIDEYFDNVNDFGDSDYAHACLEAYRDGKTPPEIHVVDHRKSQLKGNEEILEEIAAIEAKLGRHLTDAELDKLLCGDDEDDDLYHDINATKKSSDDMIDSIVDTIYDRIAERLGLVVKTQVDTSSYESLDEFIDREKSKTEVTSANTAIPQTSIILNAPTTEALIGMHNRLKNDVPVESVDAPNDTKLSSDDESDESDADKTNSLPPSSMLGGSYNEADFIDVGASDELDNIDKDEIDVEDIDMEIHEQTIVKEVSAPAENNEHLQHQRLVNSIISDCRLASADITREFDERIRNYFTKLDIEVNDIFTSLVPSNGDDKLFTVLVTIRVTGDYEIINMMHINTVILMYLKNIAERFNISEDLFDTEINVVDSDSTFDMDLKALNTLNKNFTSQTIDNIYSALSAVSAYIYKRLNKLIEVRFVNDPRSNEFDLYFISKSDEPLDAEFEEFYRVELDGEGILNEIFDGFNFECYVIYHLIMNDNDEEEFFEKVRQIIGYHVIETPLANRYIKSTKEFMSKLIGNNDIELDTITASTSLSTGRKNLILDLIYRIYTKQEVTREQVDDLAVQYDIYGEYLVQLENVLRAITMNSQVSVYVEYPTPMVDEDIDDNENTEEENDTPKTSNFGI